VFSVVPALDFHIIGSARLGDFVECYFITRYFLVEVLCDKLFYENFYFYFAAAFSRNEENNLTFKRSKGLVWRMACAVRIRINGKFDLGAQNR